MEQNITENKPLQEAMIDYFNWANGNIFGKERSRKDAYEYGFELFPGSVLFHNESDALRNISSDDLDIAFAPNNSTTNMMLNIDRISSADYIMTKSFREWKLGTKITTNTVANVGSVTAQTLALSGLTALNYYVISIPVNKDCTLTISNTNDASLINNSALLATLGMKAGLNTFMFQMKAATTAVTLTMTATGGVGLATGTNTVIKLYPVTLWTTQELKIIFASD